MSNQNAASDKGQGERMERQGCKHGVAWDQQCMKCEADEEDKMLDSECKSNLSRVGGELPPRPQMKKGKSTLTFVQEFTAYADTLTAQLAAVSAERDEANKQVAYFDELQGKYSLQAATETAERLRWQSRAEKAEAERDAYRVCDKPGCGEVDAYYTLAADYGQPVVQAVDALRQRAEDAEAERDEARAQLRTVLEREAKTTARYDTKLEAAESAFRERTEELERARYAPMGDNHHNALECPYCNPARAPLRERGGSVPEQLKKCKDHFTLLGKLGKARSVRANGKTLKKADAIDAEVAAGIAAVDAFLSRQGERGKES